MPRVWGHRTSAMGAAGRGAAGGMDAGQEHSLLQEVSAGRQGRAHQTPKGLFSVGPVSLKRSGSGDVKCLHGGGCLPACQAAASWAAQFGRQALECTNQHPFSKA